MKVGSRVLHTTVFFKEQCKTSQNKIKGKKSAFDIAINFTNLLNELMNKK